MKYQFVYKNTSFDYWQLAMYYTYGSIVGVCNVIFTIAMILLTFKIWGDASSFVRMILLFACGLFPIIQPLGIYSRAKRQASLSKEIKISFDESKIYVETNQVSSQVEWKLIKKISKKPNMIIIFSTTTQGFVLTNKVLGMKKDEFYNFVISKINR
jgi:hypothetical protein